MSNPTSALRADLALLASWIPQGARVLDLGCGSGDLLAYLGQHKSVRGYGVEIEPELVNACIARGVNVLQADLDSGLADYASQSFDVVLMSSALQALARPDAAVQEMLRVGKRAMVTFPNFGHWRVRASLALSGRMPVTPALPERWYNTPNIHFCTVADFEQLAQARGWPITRRALLDAQHRSGLSISLMPNWFSELAVYELGAG